MLPFLCSPWDIQSTSGLFIDSSEQVEGFFPVLRVSFATFAPNTVVCVSESNTFITNLSNSIIDIAISEDNCVTLGVG